MSRMVEFTVDESNMSVKMILWCEDNSCKVLNSVPLVVNHTKMSSKANCSITLKMDGDYGTSQKTFKFVYDLDKCVVNIDGEKRKLLNYYLNSGDNLVGYEVKHIYCL